jgi:hypothetical protein
MHGMVHVLWAMAKMPMLMAGRTKLHVDCHRTNPVDFETCGTDIVPDDTFDICTISTTSTSEPDNWSFRRNTFGRVDLYNAIDSKHDALGETCRGTLVVCGDY